MPQATLRSDHEAAAQALGAETNPNTQSRPAPVASADDAATTDSEFESEIIPRGETTDTDMKSRTESESATCKTSVSDNKKTDNVDNEEVKNIKDGGDSRTEKGYKDSGDALEQALLQLGAFGLYQRYMVLLLCIPNVLAAMYSLNYVFVADHVPFRCVVPECEGAGSHFDNETVQALLAADRCRRYQPLLSAADQPSCAPEHFHPTDTVPCDSFVYENMDTVYAEFNMACNEWQRTLVGTVRNAALPFALVLTGYISDSWGRRTAFCLLSACAGALGIVKSLMPHYYAYLALEFLEAALGYGFNSAAYVMMVELARPSLRVAFACATGVAYGLGGVLLALLASRVRAWRLLLRAAHAPALLLPLYWLLLHESTRWLHVRGQARRAARNLRQAARWNKVTIDEDLLTTISEDKVSVAAVAPGHPWLRLLRSRPLLLRLGVCCWCWVAVAFVYYGLTINSVALSGDKYTNFALNMAMEVVASLLIMMALERFGRKKSIFVAFLVCGVACLIPLFVSHSGTGLGMFFLGKLSITFAFNSLYVFTAELFPTDARSSALAAASLVGRLGSVLAPQTPLLSVYVQALLYGGCSVSAALLLLLTPETRRAALPQRAQHAETLRAQHAETLRAQHAETLRAQPAATH